MCRLRLTDYYRFFLVFVGISAGCISVFDYVTDVPVLQTILEVTSDAQNRFQKLRSELAFGDIT